MELKFEMQNKICSKCKQEKEICEFNKHKNRKDGFQTYCKECSRNRSREYYSVNHEKQIKHITFNKKARREKLRDLVFNYLINNPCVDCGEKDPRVLEFDHREDKEYNVSNLLSKIATFETIIKEISKCDVRCANCHRRKTAIDYNQYKHRKYVEMQDLLSRL
jgi:hypothetical protein